MDKRVYLFKGRKQILPNQVKEKRNLSENFSQLDPVNEYLCYIYQCKPCSIVLTDIMKRRKSFSTPDIVSCRQHETQTKTNESCRQKNTTYLLKNTLFLKKKRRSLKIYDIRRRKNKTYSNENELKKSSSLKGEGVGEYSNYTYKIVSPSTQSSAGSKRRLKKLKKTNQLFYSIQAVRPEELKSMSASCNVSSDRGKTLQNITLQTKINGSSLQPPATRARDFSEPPKKVPKITINDESTFVSDNSFTVTVLDYTDKTTNANVGQPLDTTLHVPIQENYLDKTRYIFKCSYKDCEFKSQSRIIMESHIYIHLKGTPFQCAHCRAIFPSRNSAFHHCKKTHTEMETEIMAVVGVKERQFYEETESYGAGISDGNINTQVTDSQNVNNCRATRCYCCSHCSYSTIKLHKINEHIETIHHKMVQYVCYTCSKVAYGYEEGIVKHFEVEHLGEPITYRNVLDFYDARKTIRKPYTHNGSERCQSNDKNCSPTNKSDVECHSKTSFEADSTIHELDDHLFQTAKLPHVGKSCVGNDQSQGSFGENLSTVVPKMTDPILHLTEEVNSDDPKTKNTRYFCNENNGFDDQNSSNELGIKIVNVMSLHSEHKMNPELQETQAPSISMCSSHLPVEGKPKDLELNTDKSETQNYANATTSKKTETQCTWKKCNAHSTHLMEMVDYLHIGEKEIKKLFTCSFCKLNNFNAKSCQVSSCSSSIIQSLKYESDKQRKEFQLSSETQITHESLLNVAQNSLRLIEVHFGGAHRVNNKFENEKVIYLCSKCKMGITAFKFITEHLEKRHNEMFGSIFKMYASNEFQSSHALPLDKHRSHDMRICLAIDENLLTVVQTMMKEATTKLPFQRQFEQFNSNVNEQFDGVALAENEDDDIIFIGESNIKECRVTHSEDPVNPVANQKLPALSTDNLKILDLSVKSPNCSISYLNSSRPGIHQVENDISSRNPVKNQRHQFRQAAIKRRLKHPHCSSRLNTHPLIPGMVQNQSPRQPKPAHIQLPESIHFNNNYRPDVQNMTYSRYAPDTGSYNQNHHDVNWQYESSGSRIPDRTSDMNVPRKLISYNGFRGSCGEQTFTRETNAVVNTAGRPMDNFHIENEKQVSRYSQWNCAVGDHKTENNRGFSEHDKHDLPLNLSLNTTKNSLSKVIDLSQNYFHKNCPGPLDLPTISPNEYPPEINDAFKMLPSTKYNTSWSQFPSTNCIGIGSHETGTIANEISSVSGISNSTVYCPVSEKYKQISTQNAHETRKKVGRNHSTCIKKGFKCPYCEHHVPLKMGQVVPHIEIWHPGKAVIFFRNDLLI